MLKFKVNRDQMKTWSNKMANEVLFSNRNSAENNTNDC